jgi:SAM-dependent methyltransferase
MENVKSHLSDSMSTNFDEKSFDVISCTHIYEHVSNAHKLFSEIYKLLKSVGICYFTAGNRLTLIEGHYRLPLLSVFPKPLTNLYLKILRRGIFYYENHLTFWELKKLVSSFEINDYMLKIIEDP